MKNIGKSFPAELKAAGLLGLPFSWGGDGAIEFSPSITPEQRAAVLAVYDAHNPVQSAQQLLASAAGSALTAIDVAAEAARLRYITGGSGQSATYMLKEQQARAFAGLVYTGTVPGLVQSEATARGVSAQVACSAIIGEADAWHALAAVIETARRSGKVAVNAAANLASLEAARDTALTTLSAV